MKILVPVDGSECSSHALDTAVAFAKTLAAEIVVCNVVNLTQVATMSGGEAQLIESSFEVVQEESAQTLKDALARVSSEVTASSMCAEGEPVQEIERIAGEITPAFIVIGSHGRSGVARALMGSVAEGVVRRAAFPVMVVPCRPLVSS